ncbi:histidine kinase dimerization/phospho-acceptor domain-containing protein [Bradyrhizobium sp. RP6]|uniref:histidine kinase dimerization/phospho-acceptor domain-containing protein n=1 Tax=Bradyrhizobium sp. RP6 TaxID=2489596 RepID=UPI001FE0D4F7|nr:histidine kinase dimerization/phospho-acceptor domain-containing protein [Bradyrhizobium sp. RP6]
MSVSPAHELNQPLTDILINAEPAQQKLENLTPDLGAIGGTLDHIRRDGQRTAEVIGRLRSLLKRDTT